MLNRERVFNDWFHVTDWLPTILTAAGINVKLKNIDGIDQWASVSHENIRGKRKEVPINIDEGFSYEVLISNGYKLINSTTLSGKFNDWLGVLEENSLHPLVDDYEKLVMESLAYKSLRNISDCQNSFNINNLRHESTISCSTPFQSQCNSLTALCLFDLRQDPCERNNIALNHPHKVQALLQRLQELRDSMVPMKNKFMDPNSNPKYHNSTWTWWKQTKQHDLDILAKTQSEIRKSYI